MMIEFFLICQISIESLIKDLGDNNYQKRIKSYNELAKIGYEKIPYIIKNLENKDLEIKLSCQKLYNEYFYITSPDGDVPSIWYLEEKERFPKGYKIKKFNKKSLCYIEFERDISLEYYDKYSNENNFCYDYWCIYQEFCECVFYKNLKIAKLAMKDFIKEQLEKGRSREEIQNIVNKASNKMKTHSLYHRTKDPNGEEWDWWNGPPGPTIEKSKYKYPGY